MLAKQNGDINYGYNYTFNELGDNPSLLLHNIRNI